MKFISLLDRMQDPHILTWIFIIMTYGFSEIGIGISRRTLFRQKKTHDATVFAVTVPAMTALFGALFEAVLRNPIFPAVTFGIGCGVLASGIILRLTALHQIGRGFSTQVERSDNQRLKNTGIYQLIRHPLYCATLLQVIGTGVLLHSLVAFIIFPLCVAGIIIRINKEEHFMSAEFPQYRGYMKKTWRLVPWIY
jgi:protein-S-isoprenylcysteine O-methyltransferase Ste14